MRSSTMTSMATQFSSSKLAMVGLLSAGKIFDDLREVCAAYVHFEADFVFGVEGADEQGGDVLRFFRVSTHRYRHFCWR